MIHPRRAVSLPTILFSLTVMILTSCATGGGRQVPDWVLQPPVPTRDTEFFVVSGFDAGGNETRASESAANALILEINQYLGVNVDLLSQSEGRGSIDEYEESLRTTINVTGSGQLAGLRIQDRYTREDDRGITVYVLAAYDKNALEAERAKREALIAEQEDAVSRPEAEGKAAVAQGDLAGALRGYANASLAALGSGIRNADIKFERNMMALAEVIRSIELKVSSLPSQLLVNRQPTEAFEIEVLFRGRPAAGVDILASFAEAQSGGRTRIRNVNLTSDQGGIAHLVLPPPTLIGNQTLSLQPDLSGYLRGLEEVPREYRALSDALFDNAASVLTRVPYQVISLAREVPMGLLVLDLDAAGNPSGERSTASGINETLTAGGFRISQLNLSASQLGFSGRINPQTVIQYLDQQNLQGVDRLVLGTASLSSVEERDGYIVRVNGTVEVYDRHSGQLLFSQSGIKTSQSSSSQRAISSAFTDLGRDFGAAIIRGLP